MMKDFLENNKLQSMTALFLLLVTLFSAGAGDPRDLSQEKQILSLYEQADQIAYESGLLVQAEQYEGNVKQWEHLSRQASLISDEAKKLEDQECQSLIDAVSDYANQVSACAQAGSAFSKNETLDGEDDFLTLKEQLGGQKRSRKAVEALLGKEYKSVARDVGFTYKACSLSVPENLPAKIVSLKKAEEERVAQEKAQKEAEEQKRIAAEQEKARIAAEQEQAKIAAERAAAEEQERIAAEQAAKPDTQAVSSDSGSFIANASTGKVHYPSCQHVKRMKESNKVYVDSTDGWSPCGTCMR